MLVDVDSWPREYQACETLSQRINLQLLEWGNYDSSTLEYSRLLAAIQVGLKQLDADVRQLKLNQDISGKHNLTSDEARHRQEQENALQNCFQELQRRYRHILNSTSHGISSEDRASSAVIDFTDVNAIRQHQVDILERQNRGLEALSETISRQRSLASQLGQEVEDQNGILNNLADTMERVDSRVHSETGNIREVNHKDKAGYYWLVIILLFVAIIIVAVI